jgi:predicted enzyme related to lactoylglutathione lyase
LVKLSAPILLLLLAALARPAALFAADAPASPTRRPGKFVWADLVTTNPAAAVEFYTKLFGWTAQKTGPGAEGYTLLLNGDRPMGGVAYRPADPQGKAAGGARWIGTVAVTDINQAVAAVTAAGGRTLVAPRLVADRGWQAVVADQEGSVFGLLVSETGDAAKSAVGDNDWAWVQLLSRHPAEAAAFYEKALGYVVTDDARTVTPHDRLLTRDGVAYAGLTPLPEGRDTRGGWLGYVRVPQVQAAVDTAKALGGQVLVAPRDLAGAMQVAVITDPLGGAIGLVSVPAHAGKEDAK